MEEASPRAWDCGAKEALQQGSPCEPSLICQKENAARGLQRCIPAAAHRKQTPGLPMAGRAAPPASPGCRWDTHLMAHRLPQRPDVRKDHAERCFTILPLITETTRVRPLLLASILYKHPMARNRELCCRRLCLVMPAGHSIPMSCFQEAITYKMSTSTTGRAPICFQGAWPCCMYFLHILPSPCIPPLGGTFKESPGMLCLEQNCSNSAPAQMCSSMCTGGRG